MTLLGGGYLEDVDILPYQENIIPIDVYAFAPQWNTGGLQSNLFNI
jgi:hypothetical protein